jgi:hypothetical protein
LFTCTNLNGSIYLRGYQSEAAVRLVPIYILRESVISPQDKRLDYQGSILRRYHQITSLSCGMAEIGSLSCGRIKVHPDRHTKHRKKLERNTIDIRIRLELPAQSTWCPSGKMQLELPATAFKFCSSRRLSVTGVWTAKNPEANGHGLGKRGQCHNGDDAGKDADLHCAHGSTACAAF